MVETAKNEPKPAFKVKVEGQYWASTTHNQNVKKKFEIACMIPANQIQNINGLLKARLLPQLIEKSDINFIRLRTFSVITTTPVGGVDLDALTEEQQIRLMSHPQLVKFIKKKKLPIDTNLYTQLEPLRTAVQLAQKNPEFYAKREAELAKGVSVSNDILAMNRDASVTTETDTTDEADDLSKL